MTPQPNRTPLFLAVGALALAAAAVVTFVLLGGEKSAGSGRGSSGDAPAPEPARPLAATDAVPAEARGARDSSVDRSALAPAPVEAALPAAYARALSGIVGRVVEVDGRPVAGAPVELLGGLVDFFTVDPALLLFHPDEFEPRIVEQKVKTDAEGRFRFARVDPRLFFLIGVNLGQGRPAIRFVDRTPNPGESADLGDIPLDPPLTLSGRVVGPGGKAIGGARVRASSLPGVVYQAGVGNVGPHTTFLFKGPRMGEGSEGERPVLWTMPRWTETLFDKLPFPSTRTRPDGSFDLEGAPSGALTLVVDGPDLPVTHQSLPASKGERRDVGEITVQAGEELDGIVVDEKDAPVPGADVMVGIPSPMQKDIAFMRKPITAGPDGKFSARGLGGTTAIVAARAHGMGEWRVAPPKDLDGDSIRVRVPAPRSVLVRVKDGAGKPLAAKLTAQRKLDGPELFPQILPPLSMKSEETEPGVYRLRGFVAGPYHVFAKSEGYAIGKESVKIEGDSEPEIALVLRPERRIRVTVTAKEVPLEAAHVFAAPPEGDGQEFEKLGYMALASARTDAKGVALVSTAEAGKLTLVASHPGYAAGMLKFEIAKDSAAMPEAAIALLVGGTLEGHVHRAGALPEKPQMIALSGRGQEEPIQMPRLTVSDFDGNFRFTHLHPGEYEVMAQPRVLDMNLAKITEDFFELLFAFGGADRAESRVTIRDEEVTKVDLDLSTHGRKPTAEDGSIAGVVRLNGEGMANARVMVSGGEFRMSKTDAAGRFDAGAFKAGDHWVSVQKPGGNWEQLGSRMVKLKPGEQKFLEFDIKLAGPLRGRVVSRESGKPIAGAQVGANSVLTRPVDAAKDFDEEMMGGGPNVNAVTSENGEFSFDSLPEGNYHVRASAPGFAPGGPPALVPITRGSAAPPLEIVLGPGVRVEGRAAWAGGAKMSWGGISFTEVLTDGSHGSNEWIGIDVSTGNFSTDSLAPGRYSLQLYGAAAPEKSGGSDENDLQVSAAMNLNFAPQQLEVPAAGLKGITIKFEAQKPTAAAKEPKKDEER